MGNYSGGKFSNAHSTAIDAAVPLLKFFKNSPLVTKISLGFISPMRGSSTAKRTIKIDGESESACLKITVRGGTALQEIRVYTPDKKQLAAEIQTMSEVSDKGFSVVI